MTDPVMVGLDAMRKACADRKHEIHVLLCRVDELQPGDLITAHPRPTRPKVVAVSRLVEVMR